MWSDLNIIWIVSPAFLSSGPTIYWMFFQVQNLTISHFFQIHFYFVLFFRYLSIYSPITNHSHLFSVLFYALPSLALSSVLSVPFSALDNVPLSQSPKWVLFVCVCFFSTLASPLFVVCSLASVLLVRSCDLARTLFD